MPRKPKVTRHGATQTEADREAKQVLLRLLPVSTRRLDVLAERWGCSRSEVVATLLCDELGEHLTDVAIANAKRVRVPEAPAPDGSERRPMKHDTSWTPLCVDRSQEYVDAVLSDHEWKNKSADKRLGEVMRRSKGSVSPRRVWFLLTGNQIPIKGAQHWKMKL